MHPRTARWFAEYAADHRHPTNRLTHKVAIPMIVFHIVVMLGWVTLGQVGGVAVSLGHVAWVLAGAFWVLHLPVAGALLMLVTLPALLWGGAVPHGVVYALAAVGWTIQLAGHAVWEKNRPSFLQNILQALVGPLFFVALLTGQWRPTTTSA